MQILLKYLQHLSPYSVKVSCGFAWRNAPSKQPYQWITRLASSNTSVAGGRSCWYASQGGADARDVTKYLNIWYANEQFYRPDILMPGLGIVAEIGFVNAYHAFGTTGTATAPSTKEERQPMK